MNSKLTALLASVQELLNEDYGLELSAAKADDYKAKYPELADAIDIVVEADPTSHKKYLDWSVSMLRKTRPSAVEPLTWAENIAELVKQYDAALPRLRGPDRDLHSFKTVADMKAAVSRAQKVETRGDVRQKAKKGGVILYEDDRWQLVHPVTMDGAIYWGANTSWCISRRDKANNYFYRYAGENNVQFYLLIDKQAQAYTEEVAKESYNPHYSKLAILYSDGVPFKEERYQDAANRRPDPQLVEEVIGEEFLDKINAIAKKHAAKNKTTWSFELLNTGDPATFKKLYTENKAEVQHLEYLDEEALSSQLENFADEEITKEIVEGSLSKPKSVFLRALATTTQDEALLLRLAQDAADMGALEAMVEREDIFKHPKVIDAFLARDLSGEYRAGYLYSGLLSNPECPPEVFITTLRRLSSTLLKDQLYTLVRRTLERRNSGSLTEKETLAAIDALELSGGSIGAPFGSLMVTYLLSTGEDPVPKSVADRITQLPLSRNAENSPVVYLAQGKLAPQTMMELMSSDKLLSDRYVLSLVLSNLARNKNATPEVLEALFDKISGPGIPLETRTTVGSSLARNDTINSRTIDKMLEVVKQTLGKGFAMGNVLFNSLTANPRFPVDKVRDLLRMIQESPDLPENNRKIAIDTACRVIAVNNKNPAVQKEMIDRGYASSVVSGLNRDMRTKLEKERAVNFNDQMSRDMTEVLRHLFEHAMAFQTASPEAKDTLLSITNDVLGGRSPLRFLVGEKLGDVLEKLADEKSWNPSILETEERFRLSRGADELLTAF